MGSKPAQDGANSETMSVLVASDLDGTDALEKLGPFSTELNTHTPGPKARDAAGGFKGRWGSWRPG